ncbi:MAG: class I SAM-dependent methyltransferase [Nitrospirota bacterium]
MIGKELIYDDSLSFLERLYVHLFGAPISGLRIRCRRILPKIKKGSKKILDAGCGTGTFTFEIAKNNPDCEVIGIDSMAKLVNKANNIAKMAGIKNCSFVEEDVLEMRYKDEFDMVLCIDNLEHIEDDDRAIKNIYNALKDKGIAIIHVPAYYRRWIFFGKKVNFDVEGHVRPGYKFDDLVKKIKKAKFHIQEIGYTYGFFETISNNISYLITGADRKNKYIYALAFPILNAIAYLGRNDRPKEGAGILAVLCKDENLTPLGQRGDFKTKS